MIRMQYRCSTDVISGGLPRMLDGWSQWRRVLQRTLAVVLGGQIKSHYSTGNFANKNLRGKWSLSNLFSS